ncbi:Hsp20/alpha crystallin family protein [Paenibacillus sp. GSMTC-2017]|uniref:Hsp20/alpha crystallin family protein n=1 Tax=Paenibacillus sp. GSMTC-2017 TaxID=2794350 RepID=UPI0018D9C16F|nr:Hsp20/alpha crystallin family protein [Paenibacillus sp. GSMTC-2017]MBH5318094.1 Hsp20/alpha crystallin family protein [Paenibacillus sp. GSMTC-2017]
MTSKWEDLERWMEGQKLPRGFDVLREPDWVEHFVRKMMTKALPDIAGHMSATTSAAISESKQFLGVKFKLPDGCKRDDIRLLIREDMIRIEGLPGGKHELIKLPKLVQPRLSRATVKAGVLHVKVRKRMRGRKVNECPINWV